MDTSKLGYCTLGGDEAFRPAVLPTLGAMVDPLMPLLA